MFVHNAIYSEDRAEIFAPVEQRNINLCRSFIHKSLGVQHNKHSLAFEIAQSAESSNPEQFGALSRCAREIEYTTLVKCPAFDTPGWQP